MKDILNSFIEAWRLITSFDGEIYGIITLSLAVTILSTTFSFLLGVPSGILIGSRDFCGRRILLRIIHTFMGLPPVVAV